MILNKDEYENTIERPQKEAPNPMPPPPRQNRQEAKKPVAEQRKNHGASNRGFANLHEVELTPVKQKSQEKQDLENWSQLVPHKKVAAVVHMLNQKEATNGTLLSGNQMKNKVR